jgi:RHS repeat-associated protein
LSFHDGSLLRKEEWRGEVNGDVQLTYDNSFRISRQKVNNIDSVSFTYDNDDLLRRAGALGIARSSTHGKPTADTLGGVIGTYAYDTFGNLSSMSYRHGSTTLYTVSYTRDALDRITRKTETVEGVTTTHDYTYDLAGRLFQVKKNDTLTASYFYDPNGNRLARVTPTQTDSGSYDAQDRLVRYGNAQYFYTPRGELSTKIEGEDTTKYTYDALGNLVVVMLPNGDRIEYLIDGKNRRIGKKLNGVTVKRWIYDGDLRLVAEVDSAGRITARFVYAEKPNVAEYIVKGGVTYRVITDHLGSWRLLVNASTGAVAARAEYDEWGNVTASLDTLGIPFGFAGGLYEPATKLVRFGARDYDAETGRWTAKDPIGFGGRDVNLYAYAFFDPINSKDDNGLLAFGGWAMPATFMAVGASINVGAQFVTDVISRRELTLTNYVGAAVGGAVAGLGVWAGVDPRLVGIVAGGFGELAARLAGGESIDTKRLALSMTVGAALGYIPGTA